MVEIYWSLQYGFAVVRSFKVPNVGSDFILGLHYDKLTLRIDKGSLCVFRCNHFKHLLSFDEFDASLPGIGGVQYNVDMSCKADVNT